MRIFSNKQDYNSSIFGDNSQKDNTISRDSTDTNGIWGKFLNKKSEILENSVLPNAKTLSCRQSPGNDSGGASILNSSKISGSSQNNNLINVKTKLEKMSEKSALKEKLTVLDKKFRGTEVEDVGIPKLNSVSKCSSSGHGKVAIPYSSVSIFDKDPFSHIKDDKKKIVVPREKNVSRKNTMKSSDILDRAFNKLSSEEIKTKLQNEIKIKSIFDNK